MNDSAVTAGFGDDFSSGHCFVYIDHCSDDKGTYLCAAYVTSCMILLKIHEDLRCEFCCCRRHCGIER